MRKLWLFAAVAAFGCTYTGTASAGEFDYYQSTGVRQVSHNLGFGAGCACAPEPTCCEPEPSCCAPDLGGCCDAGCTGSCNSCCGGSCGIDLFGECCLGDAWELYNNECNGIRVGGWAQFGYHTQGVNGVGTDLFNNYPNRVQAQQLYMFAEKATDTGGCGWDFGFRVDGVYGTDAPDTQAFGARANTWDNPWDYGEAYGAAIPQLYGTVAYNDLTVKIGKFYTIIGYETVTAPDNFFYSHAYSQYLAEPFTHTGVLAEFAYNDNVTLFGGYTLGWDTGFTRNGGDLFLGGVSAQVTDNITATYALTYGDFGSGVDGSDDNGYSHSIVVDWVINDCWEYVFQSDYINNNQFLNSNDNLVTVNQYLYYTVSDCVKFGIRAEYFDDPRVGDEIYEVTLGMNYKPHANVVIRPEVRLNEFEPGASLPVSGGPARDTALFGIDAILTF